MKKQTLYTVILLLVASVSLIGAWLLWQLRAARLQYALDGLPAPETTPVRLPMIGLNTDLRGLSSDEAVTQLALATETGFRWIRQPLDQSDPQQGNWAAADEAFKGLSESDLLVLARLQPAPGSQPDDFAAFAAAVADRYGHVISAYEIDATDPDRLVAASATLREADPEALILAGGLTVESLHTLYAAGAGDSFDAVAAQVEGGYEGETPGLFPLRVEMEAAGDADKALWITGLAWPVSSESASISLDLAFYRRALTEWPWLGPVFLDSWLLSSGSARDQLRPAFEEFNGALWPGLYAAQNEVVSYSGEWEFSELGADFAEPSGSVVDVPFRGSQLAPLIRRGDYRAYLYVTVDDQPADLLPRDARGAYLVLTDYDYQPRLEALPVASGSLDQTRIARMESERGWDQFALVGYAVANEVDTRVYDYGIPALLLIALAALALGWRLTRRLKVRDWLQGSAGGLLRGALSLAGRASAWLLARFDVLARLDGLLSLALTGGVALIFYFSPWLPLTLLALAALALLIFARPYDGLALAILAAPFYQSPRPLFGKAFPLVEILVLISFAAWLLHQAAARPDGRWPGVTEIWARMRGIDRALLAFLMLGMVSLAWADLTGVAFTELRQVIVQPLAFYLMLRSLPLTHGERLRLVDLLLIGGVLVALIGFYELITGVDVITAEGGSLRLRSVYGSPNSAALFLDRLVPIGAAWLLMGKGDPRRWWYTAAAALTGAAALATLSRGALLLGLPAGLSLVLVLAWGRLGLGLVIGGAALLGLALIPLMRLPRFAGLFDFSQGTSFFRVQLYNSTFQLLADHPLTGVGLDQFLYAFRGHYIQPAAWAEPDLSHPHNFLLNYWVRLGILGLAVGIWIQVAFWRMALSAWRFFQGRTEATLIAGLMGSMAAMLAHGLVDEPHFAVDLAYLLSLTLALMAGMAEEARNGNPDTRAKNPAGAG